MQVIVESIADLIHNVPQFVRTNSAGQRIKRVSIFWLCSVDDSCVSLASLQKTIVGNVLSFLEHQGVTVSEKRLL